MAASSWSSRVDDVARSSIDLTRCDEEPIQVPGSIQRHGALVALSLPELTVLQLSSNVGSFVGLEPSAALGRPFEQLIGAPAGSEILAALARQPPAAQHAFRQAIGDRDFDVSVHRIGNVGIVEFEPAEPATSEAFTAFRTALVLLQRSTTLEDLWAAAAEQLRAMTGFDRVMVYRFEDDGHGQVVAEAKAEEMNPYLGQHYPASDIPRQARRLYLLNWIRVIPDVEYTPVPLVLAPGQVAPLDLSLASLRSVSPVHLEYLRNMGVAASMSVSLVCGGRLWGLLACHHRQPLIVPVGVRAACEVLGRLLSLQIEALSGIAARAERERLRERAEALGAAMHEAKEGWKNGLLLRDGEMLSIVGASGAAIWEGGQISTIGETPCRDDIAALVEWLNHRDAACFETHALAAVYPPARRYHAVASGLLAISVPRPVPAYVLWFREEALKAVTWAGDPSKPAQEGDRLGPRRSFEAWREVVRFSSSPWTVAQLEVAEDLRRRAIEVDLEHQITRAQRAVDAREEVLAIVSHDLRNPLNVIQLSAAKARREVADERVSRVLDQIQRATDSMNGLISDLLDLGAIDAGRFQVRRSRHYARDIGSDVVALLTPLAAAKSIRLTWSGGAELSISADRERLLQVFSNIVGNALKFTAAGGVVAITASADDGYVRFAVSDSGPGIAPEDLARVFDRYWKVSMSRRGGGVGLGLYVAQGILAAHGGRIWVESTLGKGTTFFFTVPIAEE
jgi:two-component system, chemotaxis family, sensor kinase Cph1